MALSWRKRRQVLYYGAGGVVLLVLLLIALPVVFSRQVTCFDGVQNGSEEGVDCGGSCTRLCPMQANAPLLQWNRGFPVSSSTYAAAAYVENNNVGAYARNVRYVFNLYEGNSLVGQRIGTTDIPPVQFVPIVETNISVGNRTVTRSEFFFADEEIRWERNTRDYPALRTTGLQLEPDGSRLTATLVNDSIQEARDVAAAAIVYDAAGIARAASRTVVPRLARQSSAPLVFTWPGGVEGAQRAEIILLPSVR